MVDLQNSVHGDCTVLQVVIDGADSKLFDETHPRIISPGVQIARKCIVTFQIKFARSDELMKVDCRVVECFISGS